MNDRRLDNKGQISAEYLLLFLVIIIIMGSITIPLVRDSTYASMDVSAVSDARTAMDSIVNAANVVYANGPGAHRTLNVYIPHNTGFQAGANYASLTLELTDGPKTVNATTNHALNANNGTLAKGWYTVNVTWESGTSPINVILTQT